MTDLFLRQIHPSWVGESGDLQSRSFIPTAKDEGKLSVDDSTKATPESSFKHFTEVLGLQSAGTWAVSAEEVAENPELSCDASPLHDNPAHCSLNFPRGGTKGEIKNIGQKLAAKASKRGRLYKG
jgi:hypothetical protein